MDIDATDLVPNQGDEDTDLNSQYCNSSRDSTSRFEVPVFGETPKALGPPNSASSRSAAIASDRAQLSKSFPQRALSLMVMRLVAIMVQAEDVGEGSP